MICSASELDLWDDHAGILKLSDETKLGSDFSKIYNSTDTLWEIGVTPNRGDCMSHLGIARELSNYFNLTLKENSQTLKSNIENVIKVNSGKIKACNSYQSIEIENFTLSDSNLNIRYRLSSIGVRVINNVVDYTNYVLHDIGQPLHAFDRDKLFGTISVRFAKDNENLKTLDEQVRKLTSEDLIITDNDKPIALAGVMGGYDTEVTDTTTNLLIESAYFDKVSIMKTSRRLNLISDASIRFERGIDFNLQKQGLQRFVNLFENDQEINYSSIIDSSKNGISYDSISFDKNEIEQILGVELDDNFIKNTLINLQIESEISDKKIKFKSPSWRYDLERPIDSIEELAKHYGFNNFESTLPIGNNLNSTGTTGINVSIYLKNYHLQIFMKFKHFHSLIHYQTNYSHLKKISKRDKPHRSNTRKFKNKFTYIINKYINITLKAMVSHIGITKLIIYTIIQNIKNLKSYQIKNIHLVY